MKASQSSKPRIALEKKFAGFGNKYGGSTILARVGFQIFLLFFGCDDVVPVRLTIPDGDFVHVSSTIPFDRETDRKPIYGRFETPIPFKAGQNPQYKVGDGIVDLFDCSKQSSRGRRFVVILKTGCREQGFVVYGFLCRRCRVAAMYSWE